jgi:hypothetical protein
MFTDQRNFLFIAILKGCIEFPAFQGNPNKLEGEFSSYSLKWTQTITNVFAFPMFISGTRLFFQDSWNLETYVRELSDGSAVDNDSFTVDLSLQSGYFMWGSVTGKYIVRLVSAASFEIWKNGAILDTITIAGSSQDIETICISSNGQYIVVADEANNAIICYEGS